MTFLLYFCISAITTAFLLPKINKIALKFGFSDLPDPRKQHKKPLVRFGGLAMAISFYISLISISILFKSDLLNNENLELLWVVTGSSLGFFLVGLIDDIFQISPFPRLILQIIIASSAWANGLSINAIHIPFFESNFNHIYLPVLISLLITILWLVGITNAINWLDGLDGLASGIVAISGLELFIISSSNNNFGASILAIILTGCCIGLLRYNFYPASILMGDCGSYFIGYNIAALSIIVCSEIEKVGGFSSTIFYIGLATTILFLPVFDMIFVILSRIKSGSSPFYPDRRHLHHRLIKKGLDHRSAVLLIYALTLWFGSISLMSARINTSFYWFIISTIILFIIMSSKTKKFKHIIKLISRAS